MKIIATSDIHGNLPKVSNSGDTFVAAGDLCPTYNHSHGFQKHWLKDNFLPWLNTINCKHKIFIFGNHDFVGEDEGFVNYLRSILPKNCYLLNDSGVTIDGIKFWGSSWCNIFGDWAFMKADHLLVNEFAKIDPETNVLITHTPPYGMLDKIKSMVHLPGENEPREMYGECLGCKPLRMRVDVLPNLKFHFFGHIHTGRGVVTKNGCTFVNASVLDEKYKNVYIEQVVEI